MIAGGCRYRCGRYRASAIRANLPHLDITKIRHHDDYMRTTLTLEDDLAERIADLARETRRPFKTVLNETLRRGLGGSASGEREFHIKAHPGKLRPGIDDRRFNELAWELDVRESREEPPLRKRGKL
jgi:hypothetical protein